MDSATTTRDGFPIPGSRLLTVRDLERMPDDGHRYELIDGVLIVTPAPGFGTSRSSSNSPACSMPYARADWPS